MSTTREAVRLKLEQLESAAFNAGFEECYDGSELRQDRRGEKCERLKAEILALLDESESGERAGPYLTMSRLHQYLTEAYKAGADAQRDGAAREKYEMRVAQAESWARKFIDLRRDVLHPDTEQGVDK